MPDKERDTLEWEETDFLDDDDPRVQAAMAVQAAAAHQAAMVAQAATARRAEGSDGEAPEIPNLEPWKQGLEAFFDPETLRALQSVHDITDPKTRYSWIAHQYRFAYKKPSLTRKAKRIGGYTRETKPGDTDQVCEQRANLQAVHREIFDSSVSGEFANIKQLTEQNVLLEILQNAEPNDSKGTWYGFEFYAHGKWRSVIEEMGKFENNEIEALRIVDNGMGYTPGDVTTMGGSKGGDKTAAGKFGSGMKMADRVALGFGMQITRYSRNWRAVPGLKPVVLQSKVEKIPSYSVDFFDECMPGSVVEYRNLTGGMIEAARRISQTYIPLDPGLEKRIASQNEQGLILHPGKDGGMITVHGRYYEPRTPLQNPLLFSYDLLRCTIDDQGRHYVGTSEATQNIRTIWENTSDVALFLELFKTMPVADKRQGVYEHSMDGLSCPPAAFTEAAKQFFKVKDLGKVYVGNSASPRNIKEERVLRKRGYQAIEIRNSEFLEDTFHNAEIYNAYDLLKSITVESTDMGGEMEDYKDETFPSCASRGVTAIESFGKPEMVVIVAGKEVPYAEFIKSGKYNDPKVREFVWELVVRINGSTLEIPDFDKFWNMPESARRLLAMVDPLFRASIATGVTCYIRTDQFEFEPEKSYQSYKVHARKWRNFPKSDLEIHICIENTRQASELRKLHEYSLRLNPAYQPFERTETGDIVSIDGDPKIYEQGIRKPKLDTSEVILSYDFPFAVTKDNLKSGVRSVAGRTNRMEVAEAVLRKAKEEKSSKTDFAEYSLEIANTEIWKQAFEKVFGSKTYLDNLAGTKYKELALEIQGQSKMESVELHPALTKTLIRCGVRTLSDAVQADRVNVTSPTPQNAVFLRLVEVIDGAIAIALPKKVDLLDTPVLSATSMKNCFGEPIEFGCSYVNPLLADLTIYVNSKLVRRAQLMKLFKAIYTKRIEIYRSEMSVAKFAEFSMEVMMIIAHYVRDLGFIDELTGLFQTAAEREEVIERTARRIKVGAPNEDGEFPKFEDDEQRFPGVRKRKKEEAEKKLKELKKSEEKKREEEKRQRRLQKEAKRRNRGAAGNIARIGASTALLAFAVYYFGTSEDWRTEREKIGDYVAETTGKIREKIGFIRALEGFLEEEVNVQEEVYDWGDPCEGEGCRLSRESQKSRPLFTSMPELHWGRFMRESLRTIFDGKKWIADYETPDFEPVNFPYAHRIAHYQIIGALRSEISIRTMAGGYIDPESIAIVTEDGTQSKEGFTITPQKHGEFEIQIADDAEAKAIVYHTLIPDENYWEETAAGLKDSDFEALDQDAYGFYTQVPLTQDPSQIRFNFKIAPHVKNLQEFIEWIRKRPPYERIRIIRQLVEKEMNYSRSKQTAQAHRKFQSGETPEKDYLTFALNSDELRNPGEGDCDGQNTIFAMLCRLAGVPTRLTFVFHGQNGHGPAEVFLPKIGWILMDTMGERDFQEYLESTADQTIDDMLRPAPTRKQRADQRNSVEEERRRANQRIMDKMKYDNLGCEDLRHRFSR